MKGHLKYSHFKASTIVIKVALLSNSKNIKTSLINEKLPFNFSSLPPPLSQVWRIWNPVEFVNQIVYWEYTIFNSLQLHTGDQIHKIYAVFDTTKHQTKTITTIMNKTNNKNRKQVYDMKYRTTNNKKQEKISKDEYQTTNIKHKHNKTNKKQQYLILHKEPQITNIKQQRACTQAQETLNNKQNKNT